MSLLGGKEEVAREPLDEPNTWSIAQSSARRNPVRWTRWTALGQRPKTRSPSALARHCGQPQPDRIAWFGGSNTPEEPDFGFSSVPDWRDYHAQNEVFASLVAGTVFSASVTRDDGAVVHGWGTAVSGEYFAFFAKAPHLGRWLGPRDDRPGASPSLSSVTSSGSEPSAAIPTSSAAR